MPEDASPDPHAVLGVAADASADEIHAAYRRLSRSAHPDAGGSDERFRRVRRAYETLTDEHGRTGAAAVGDAGATAAPVTHPEDPRRGRAAPTTVAPDRTSARPTSRAGCLVAAVAIASVVGIVVLITLIASSSAPNGGREPGGSTPAPPDTSTEAVARWRSENEALVTAIVANRGDIGAALSESSGGVAVQPLQDACARRQRLLDELEAAAPAPREDVTRAITRFVASERQAMAACLRTPPDLDGLAAAGARGQADLRTIMQAAQP